MKKHLEENDAKKIGLDIDEMRAGFQALQASAQARLKVGGSPVFAKIIGHLSACLRVLDGPDGRPLTDGEVVYRKRDGAQRGLR